MRMTHPESRTYLRRSIILMMMLTLTACDEQQVTNGVVDAGKDREVGEGQILLLEGTASSTGPRRADSPFVAFLWSSVPETGTFPLVGQPKTAGEKTATVAIPFVDKDVELVFLFSGADSEGNSASDAVTITVKNTDGLPGPSLLVLIGGTGVLDFVHEIGTSPCPQNVGSFTVENSGGGELNYTISDKPGWVNVTPSSGSAGDEVDVDFNCGGGFAVGANAGLITVDAGQAGMAEIPVTGTVE